MDTTGISLGSGAILFVACYLLSMIYIGWLARKRRESDSLADFYLADRSMGVSVLFLTLYATQYSGNTMFGYAGRTYQIGFGWTVSALFMFACATSSRFPADDIHFSRLCVVSPAVSVPCSEVPVAWYG